ncbi:MAG: hypothetical protein O3A46_15270 [Candidatus Poribacteria bacterium]|nr:hypothetical protein [Candidatus Poribacteria bacterium]
MMRYQWVLAALAGAMIVSVASGCAAVVGASASGELSENLALAHKGAIANKELFNDGSEFTSDTTSSPRVEPDDPNWMDAEKYSVAQVELPEVTDIHKIIVKSKDLDKPLAQGMRVSVDVYTEEGKWTTLREWERIPPSKIITVNGNARGSKVRLQIKRPSSIFTGGAGGNQNQDNGDRSVYELEVYKYIVKDAMASSE